MSDFESSNTFPGAQTKKRKVSTPVIPVETQPEPEQAPAPTEPTSKFNQEDLLAIFDEIIFAGEYQEDVVIKGKLRAGFRTRSAGEVEDISRIIDGLQANLMSTVHEKKAILNLQYALTTYQGKDLRSVKSEDRAKFLKDLPGPIIGALIHALQAFDEKVYEACKEGEENF